jgi:hypothetical protein
VWLKGINVLQENANDYESGEVGAKEEKGMKIRTLGLLANALSTLSYKLNLCFPPIVEGSQTSSGENIND